MNDVEDEYSDERQWNPNGQTTHIGTEIGTSVFDATIEKAAMPIDEFEVPRRGADLHR